jgi:hypothetical protein
VGRDVLMRRLVLVLAVVALIGCEKRDPLFCAQNQNDPRCLGGGDGGVDGLDGYVSVGGNVTGKVGGGLVLLDNGGDDKLITNDGQFQFATGVPMGTAYDVTVGSQPSNPSQDCVVDHGSGTADTDVTDIGVTCSTASYAVGGIVVGYISGPLTLLDNEGDDLVFAMNGTFAFHTNVASGAPYSVSIKSGTGTGCNVSGGFGTVGNSDITTVVVNCTPNTFTIGGTITGLNGSVKLHNGSDTITVSANGSFAFPTPVGNGQGYAVTVTQQPAYPPSSQTCVVSAGTGNVNMGNVSTVSVSCTTNKFTVGGNVSGLSGTLVLLDNGGDNKTITANGPFTFTTAIFSGLTYAVTVSSKPPALTCTVTQGSGTITSTNITNVAVNCADRNIKCGSSYCAAGSQQCCDPEGNAQCLGTAQSCSQLSLPCADAAECGAGQVCCAMTHNGNGNVESVACASSCGGSNPVQMCGLGTSECRSGSCSDWSKLPGYNACQ